MERLARSLALSLAIAGVLGCRPDAGAGEDGVSEAGDSESGGAGEGDGDGEGDDELPGWPCDPLERLAVSHPDDAPPLSDSHSGIAVAGELVLACRENAPLELWSTAGDALALLGVVELAGSGCKWVAVASDGRTAAVSDPGTLDEPGFVQVIDLSDPRAPSAGPSVVGGAFEGLLFGEDATELLVAARAEGVRVFGLGEQLDERPGYVDESSDAHALALHGDQLWVAEGELGVRRFAWSEPPSSPVASVALAGVAQDLAITRLGGLDYLLVANLGGVVAIELASESISSSGPTRGISLRLAELGGEQVVLADWDALRVIDLAQVEVPRIVAHQGELGGPTGGLFGVRDVVALGEDRLLSAGLRGLELWAYDRACEAPALAAESRRLHFTPDRDDRVLNLLNEGTVALEVLSLTCEDPSVSADPGSFVIAPGGVQAVEVAIEHGEARSSSLAINSIQPELVPGRVELCADCPGLVVGDPAPALVHVDTHAELWSRDRMAGRVVMLAYFATWCGTCNDDLPLFETELWQAYAEAGALVLGLGNQQPEQVVAWARQRGLSFPILLAQDSYERWKADEDGPYSLDVVLDREGVARAIAHGGAIEDWVALFESLL
ncbi:MAG: redoxin domain-containing protein [Enhygromyxa sp.]